MDIEYMRSLYHQTHYEFFYRALPVHLKSHIFHQTLKGARQGFGNQYLAFFWRRTARNIAGLSIDDPMPREVDFTRDDFVMTIVDAAPGMTMLLMTGPPPRGPVEAGCAVAIFEDAQPLETVRYFTSEAPMEPSFPWMVGEWYDNGSRANLGGLSDASTQGMCNFVLSVMGLPLQSLPQVAAQQPTSKPQNFFKNLKDSLFKKQE